MKSLVVGVGLVAVAGVAVLTNPGPEQHRQQIRQAISDRSPIANLLGFGSLTAMAVGYHSLGVGSYTRVGDRTVSVGAFGQVFILQ